MLKLPYLYLELLVLLHLLLLFLFHSSVEWACHINYVPFFFHSVNNYHVWFVVFQYKIGWYRELLQYLWTLIFKHSLRCVFTPLASSWKSISFAHHPMNNNINSIMLPQAVLLLCEYFTFSNHMTNCLLSLFLHNLQRSKTFCWSTFLFILFVLSGCFEQPLTFPQFPSSAFLISASFNFLGSSFHMTSL